MLRRNDNQYYPEGSHALETVFAMKDVVFRTLNTPRIEIYTFEKMISHLLIVCLRGVLSSRRVLS